MGSEYDKMFAGLPANWKEDNAVFERMLAEHEFSCTYTEPGEEPGSVEQCQYHAKAMETIRSTGKGGTHRENPKLCYKEFAVLVEVRNERGEIQIDGQTGAKLERRKVLVKGVYDFQHGQRLLEAMRKAKLPEGARFDEKDPARRCVKSYPLSAHLTYLRDQYVRNNRGRQVAEFFLSLVKGEAELDAGVKLGCVKLIEKEILEKLERNEDTPVRNYLSIGTQAVASVSEDDADIYHKLRMENRNLFGASGVYLFTGPLAKAIEAAVERTKQAAEYAARKEEMVRKQAETQAKDKARREASTAHATAFIEGLASELGLAPTPVSSPKPASHTGGGKGKAARKDDHGPKRPVVIEPERDQVAEGLALAAALATDEPASESAPVRSGDEDAVAVSEPERATLKVSLLDAHLAKKTALKK